MKSKRKCALIAARPAGCRVLQRLLGDTLEVTPVQSMSDALEMLSAGQRFDLILATFAFDESHMIDFLQAIKSDRALSDIPFYCVRIHPGILGDELVERSGAACVEYGAACFVDVSALPLAAAERALKAAIAPALARAQE